MSIQITNQADYAMRAMLYLTRLGNGKQAPSNVIAEEMKMSRMFLSRINSQLSNAGLIVTRRGARGGIALSKPASEISVYDVLIAVEGPIKIIDCEKDPEFCQQEGCPFRAFWHKTEKTLIAQLKGTSLQDLADHDPQLN